jgi:3-hydroxyisobutyrate dehydrogenase-like beta-hydroxyacid dehydrogenase
VPSTIFRCPRGDAQTGRPAPSPLPSNRYPHLNAPTSPIPPPATGSAARPIQVAVLGIGMMGFPMARRLCEAGCQVTVWNRSRSKAERLEPAGAVVADTPAQAVEQADVVITLLENGAVVEDVLFQQGTHASLRPGTLVIDMSSIQPAQARDHAQRLNAVGVRHLDAPVSGGTVGAEQGTLAIMVGGDPADMARARGVLELLGRPTHVGPHGAGQLAKLANQMIVGITIGAVAEALLLCEKGGADMAQVRQAITGGFADSRILQLHGQRMVERDFTKRAAIQVQLKDMRNALATASSMGFDAPITALFEQLFADAADHGLGDLDHSALFVELASRNGMH